MISSLPSIVTYGVTQVQRTQQVQLALEDTLHADPLSIISGYVRGTPVDMVSTPMEMDSQGRVLENERNEALLQAYDVALSTPGFDVGPVRGLFENATAYPYGFEQQLSQVIQQIEERGETVFLDGVDLSDMDLTRIEFGKASCNGTRFDNSALNARPTNLGNAQLVHTYLRQP